MKHMRHWLMMVMLLCGLAADAHDFEVDGIYYNITSSSDLTVEVTFQGTDYNSYVEYEGVITIPSTVTYGNKKYIVTSIGRFAFRECNGLTSITIPESVVSIGNNAFGLCSNLTSIIIPKSVVSIEGGAFRGTAWYDNQPDGVVYINKVLYKYKGIMSENTSIKVEVGIVSISPYAFSGCSGLASIIISEGLANIGAYAFEGCNSLTSITIPEGVTSIGGGAFWGCNSLISIAIPASVTSIGSYAFDDCTNLNEVIFEDGDETLKLGYNYYHNYTLGQGLFGDCPLERVYVGRNLSYNTDYHYGYSPFYNRTKLAFVTIGEGVTNIGDYAFSGCSSLTSIIIPEGVTSIGSSTFSGCSSLTSVTIPDGVTSIESSTFSSCSSLTSVTIPDGVTSIGSRAFSGCSSLTSVIIPESVTSIGESAFSDCSGLTSVAIPNTITSINNRLFENCWKLKTIDIPESVTSIGDYSFDGCQSLEKITIPKGVQKIGKHAFYYCRGCASISIPAGVTSMGAKAFSNCAGILEINSNIPSQHIMDGGVFSNSSFTEVIIGDEVTSIGDCAFYQCGELTSITIPEGVTSIGSNAFGACILLFDVFCYPMTPISYTSFFEKSSIKTIYVPYESMELYMEADGWNNYELRPIIEVNNLTVRLPIDVLSDGYINMFIEFTNSTGEVVGKYLIGEKSTYTFYNLDEEQTYNVYIKNMSGHVLGAIHDIHINGDTNVTFDSLLQPQNLKIGIHTPDGTNVTESAIVTWYDADGNYLCKDAVLSGQVENTEVKYSVKFSKELAMQYKQPEQTAYMVKPSGNEIKVILEPFASVEVAGMVRDSVTGTPVRDAMVTISQKLNSEYFHITRAETDSKGAFKATLYDVSAEVMVAAADYISYTMSLDTLTEATALGEILMKPISGVVVSVGFTYRTSVPDGDTPEILGWYTDYDNVKYGILNKTTGLPVSNFSVQYPQLVLLDGVSAGDELLLTVVSRTSSFEPTQTVVVVDSALQCDATFDIVELGGIEASYTTTTNSAVVGILYNEIGEMAQKLSYASASLTLDNLRDGSYTLVTMGSSDYFNAIYNLAQLSAVGLVEGADYVKHTVKVESGGVSVVEMESVPAFDESKLYYTGGDTQFTVNKASTTAGNYLTLTGKIDFKEEYASKVSDVSMVIDLPESAVFVDNSVMIGAAVAAYTLEGNRLTISLPNNYTERVRFCIIPTESGSYAPTAFAQFTVDSKEVLQPIGSAHYTIKDLSIEVPSVSATKTIPVSGVAIGNSTIQIYDNDVLIGETTSLANGVWNTTCELHEPYNLSTHRIHAKVTTKLGVELISETKECMYDMNAIVVDKVTMYVNGKRTKVFDFINPNMRVQDYFYGFSLPTYTFTIEFNKNDATRISDVILYVKTRINEWIPLPAQYDIKKGLWVVSAYPYDLKNTAVNVSVDYLYKPILWGDQQKLTSDMNDVQVAFESWKADLESLDSVFNNDDIILNNSDIYDELEYLLSQENYDADRVNILLEQLKANNPDYEESNVELPDDFDFEKEREEVDMIYSQIVTEGKDSLLASLLINEDLFDGEFCIEPIVYEPEGGEYKLIMNIISSVDEWELSQKGYVSLPMTDSTVIWCKISDDSISFIDPIREIEITKVTFNESQTRSMNISRGLGDTPTSCIDVAQGLLGMFRDDDSVEAWRSNCDVIKSIMDGIACFYELMYNNTTKNDILDMLKALKDAEKARYNAWLKIISDKRVIPASDVSHLKDIEKSVAKIEKSIDEVNKFLNGPVNRLLNRLPSHLTENLPRLSNNVRTLGRVAGGFGILLKLYDTYLDCRDFMDEIESWTRLREMIERKIPCEGNQEKALELKRNIIAEGRALQNNCIRVISADVIGIAADAASLKLKNPTGVLGLYVGSVYLGLYTELSKQLSINGKFLDERTRFTNEVAMLKCGEKAPEQPNDEGKGHKSQEPDLIPYTLIDPSGYVYEGVSSNRLEGVMASCYYKEMVEDIYGDQHENIVLWDAEQYAQENPLFTDVNGMYRWDVPKGLWQVKFEKEGYETTYSEWLPVPPPQLEVNIPMVQYKQPEVAGVHAYKDGVEIEFDKYMQPATLNTDNIFVTQNGEKVAGTVTLLNEEVAYEGQSETYASKVRFLFDQAVTAKEITLTVVNSVKSYAGLQMQDVYTQTFAIEQEVEGIVADSLVSMYYGGEHTLTVKVIPAAAAAGKTLVVTSSSPMILGVDTDSIVLDDSGEAVLTVSGELPGMGAISYSLVGYDYRASTLVEVVYNNTKMTANPTASIASGTTVAKGTEVTLSCTTEGAAIYYTLDGSCPCDDTAILYDGTPIVINENTELRIMAVAEGMYESDVVVYNYYVEGVDVEEVTLPFAIDPTIVTDGFRVQGIETECTVAVYGVGGELVMQREHVKNNTFINIAHVPEGMYIVVVSKDDDTHKQRILKVK